MEENINKYKGRQKNKNYRGKEYEIENINGGHNVE